jgi:hypothetical protein
MENFLEKEWPMKMIENVSSLKRIVNRLRERGIHAELCSRPKTSAGESETLNQFDPNVVQVFLSISKREGTGIRSHMKTF